MRRAIFILIALMTAAAASAQTGLGIEQIFSERYRDMKVLPKQFSITETLTG